ncbi:MAG: LysM peptidoglycan-binding domain-containing protein [Litorilinea sp.]
MSAVSRSAISLLILALLLAACTRERPVPELLPLVDEQGTAADAPVIVDSPVGEEPEIQGNPSVSQTSNITDPLGLDDEPDVTTPEAGTTPTSGTPETFSYTVRPGDTLTELATRFDTEIDILRRLNALDSEALAVGQPLEIPYVEGMTAEGAPTPTPGPFFYTVQAGDTLSAIGARFGVDPIEIVEENGILDANNLIVGSQIQISGYAPPVASADSASDENDGDDSSAPGATASSRFVHIVQPGEGLMEIAARYGVDMNEISNANNLVNRNVLRVGQELVIPGITARDAAIRSGAVHIVQNGESLLGIALRYGVTVEEIIEFNEITNPNAISVGQQLIIPRE